MTCEDKTVCPLTTALTAITSLAYAIAFYYEMIWLSRPETNKMIIIPHIVITILSLLASYLMTLASTYRPTYNHEPEQVKVDVEKSNNDLTDTPCLVNFIHGRTDIVNFILCDIMIFGAAMAFVAQTPLGGSHSYQEYNTIMVIILMIGFLVFYTYCRTR